MHAPGAGCKIDKLLKANIAGSPIAWGRHLVVLGLTRDCNLAVLPAREELRRYFCFLAWLLCCGTTSHFAGSLFVEGDVAWHKTVVGDTSSTPSHIVLFYGCIPLYVQVGVGGFLYAMRRRPQYAQRLSLPLVIAVVAPFLILPNLGHNAWGHAFWMVEELFSAQLQWGFVVLG